MLTRRNFLKTTAVGASAMTIPTLVGSCTTTKELPNILWITSEDNSPFLGCYGDEFATTPNLDKMASEGIRYDNAYATAPVCAPARCTLITGVYPPSMGTQHMRSQYPIPDMIKYYPQYLREAGYYCTNNVKQDYNIDDDFSQLWDESSRQAHYKNRQPGQPFFAIFNFTTSHESCVHKSLTDLRHDINKVPFAPYHPDTPDVRHDWAQYYDKVEDMDKQVGAVLKELEKEGLAENTIVFYYSDHGGVLARSKRFLYDSGLRVPLIIRIPEKYKHLAPGKPGTATDRIVTFIDLPATLLSLTNVKVPEYMQGTPFLGKQNGKARDYAFSFRGRMDERYDFSRTIRDKQYRYTRNYNPHRIYGQFIEYLWRAPLTRSWEEEYKAGRCNETQSAFWEPKPAEELYDSVNDPWEINNLADDPNFKETLERMRADLESYMLKIHDSGFIPEGTFVEISKEGTTYDFVRSEKYDLPKVMETANWATSRNDDDFAKVVERLSDADELVRFWAATACLVMGEKAKPYQPQLQKMLSDSSGDVQAVAAEALCNLGDTRKSLNVLIKLLDNDNPKVALRALNAFANIGDKAKPALPKFKEIVKNEKSYLLRGAQHMIRTLAN